TRPVTWAGPPGVARSAGAAVLAPAAVRWTRPRAWRELASTRVDGCTGAGTALATPAAPEPCTRDAAGCPSPPVAPVGKVAAGAAGLAPAATGAVRRSGGPPRRGANEPGSEGAVTPPATAAAADDDACEPAGRAGAAVARAPGDPAPAPPPALE